MRRHQSPEMRCQTCGGPLVIGEFGGWDHARKLLLRDWHQASPVAAVVHVHGRGCDLDEAWQDRCETP